jgi:hypothetical protein
VSVQVGLVVESHGCGDLGGPVAVKEKSTCQVDALAGEVGVWRQAVCLFEAADQVGGVGVQYGGGLAQGYTDVDP